MNLRQWALVLGAAGVTTIAACSGDVPLPVAPALPSSVPALPSVVPPLPNLGGLLPAGSPTATPPARIGTATPTPRALPSQLPAAGG